MVASKVLALTSMILLHRSATVSSKRKEKKEKKKVGGIRSEIILVFPLIFTMKLVGNRLFDMVRRKEHFGLAHF